MKINKLIWVVGIFLVLVNIAQANLEGYTITGEIKDNAGNPLYNAKITLYSTSDSCECSSELSDYASSTGQYSSSADNLIFTSDCNGFVKGSSCTHLIDPSSDKLWIDVEGYIVLPKAFGDATSTKDRIWDSYEKSRSVYYNVDVILPTISNQEEIGDERQEDEEFKRSYGYIALINPALALSEGGDLGMEFTDKEIKDIVGEELAEQIIKRKRLEMPAPANLGYVWFGWFVLIIAALVLLTLIFIAFKKRKEGE